MSNEFKPTAAANLLIASRVRQGDANAALMRALGEHPQVAQDKMLKAYVPVLVPSSSPPITEGVPEPVIPDAAVAVPARLNSIADLGLLVRGARKAMRMNQAEFAAHVGVGRRFVSELEGGKPSLEFAKVLACAGAAGIDLFARKRSA